MLHDLLQSALESRCSGRSKKVSNTSLRDTGNSFFRASNDGYNITVCPGLVLRCLSEVTINTVNSPRVDKQMKHRIM